MRLQACLNGARHPADHPRLPVTPAALAEAAVAAVAAGADALHVHVRGDDGAESYAPASVAATLTALRAAVDVPVGVSTGAWVVADPVVRADLISRWDVRPDFASVNFNEPGAAEVAAVLLARGVGVEAGLWNSDAARALVASGLVDECARLLLEPIDADLAAAEATLADLLDAVAGVAPGVPRLLHGFGATTWPMLRRAGALGLASRIGLEDTLTLPDGRPASDNAALVAAGRVLLDG